jgi:hypothetical protein
MDRRDARVASWSACPSSRSTGQRAAFGWRPARIFPGTGARRANALIRYQGGLPTLSPCAADAILLCFRIRWQVLLVYRVPFERGRSLMWFTHLMVPLVTKLRQSYRVPAYLDDFLICPAKAGRIASVRDCRRATHTIEKLLSSLGLARHPTKGEWNGSTRAEHLGYVIDTVSMRFYVAPRKIVKVRDFARAILRQAQQGRRWVSSERLRSFCGVCVSLSLAMPFARFYTRNLLDDLTRKTRTSRAARNGSHCRLSHQATRGSADVDATRNGGGRRAANPPPRDERHHAYRRGRR